MTKAVQRQNFNHVCHCGTRMRTPKGLSGHMAVAHGAGSIDRGHVVNGLVRIKGIRAFVDLGLMHAEIARIFDVSPQYVYQVAHGAK